MNWWPVDRLLPEGTSLPFVPPKLIKRALAQVPVGVEVGIPLAGEGPWDEAFWAVVKEWWVAAAETETLRLSVKLRRVGVDSPVMVVSLCRIRPPKKDGKDGASRKSSGIDDQVRTLTKLPENGFVNVPLGPTTTVGSTEVVEPKVVEQAQGLWRRAARVAGVPISTKKVLLGKSCVPHLQIRRVEKP